MAWNPGFVLEFLGKLRILWNCDNMQEIGMSWIFFKILNMGCMTCLKVMQFRGRFPGKWILMVITLVVIPKMFYFLNALMLSNKQTC